MIAPADRMQPTQQALACCLLMQRDEHELLPVWIRYHGELFGYENLYIYDNGSRPRTISILDKAAKDLGVKVDYSKHTPEDFENKGIIFSERISRWVESRRARFYFPLDCDELVAVRIGQRYSCAPDVIRQQLLLFPEDSNSAFEVAERLDNTRHDDSTFFLLPRRRKLFFGNTRVEDMNVGFHCCRYPATVSPSPVVYFHFHQRPYQQMRRHAMRKLRLRVDPDSLSSEQLAACQGGGSHLREQLAARKGSGSHLIRCLTSTESEYAEWLAGYPKCLTTAVRDRLRELGLASPWVSPTAATASAGVSAVGI
jgi:hypothetical protein